ncbi:hypothetical protein Sbal_0825 [Shewanella baltica OS155]|uniref:Uncharacterized protein n=1 Tax=Shewanella baltica (strain OS155 / ATCC BAA-1091) TaxID=325240 RepID=A3D0T7_SHEB5|nr:hypothetical protein Sbal_0825 [Shewanella baltica OS155]
MKLKICSVFGLTDNGAIAFLVERTAIGLVRIGIVATVTVGGMDAVVEPIGIYLRRVTGEIMTIHAA